MAIYVTISYGDYGERRERLGQAQRMQPATRFWKINSGACGRMLTGSLLALQAAKGIYHVKEAIASSTLQIAPSAYISTHTYRLTQNVPPQGLAPSTWPLSVAERVYTPRDSGTLLSSWRWSSAPPTCPAAESWPTLSLVCYDLHVLQAEVKSRAILEWHLPSRLMPDDVSSVYSFWTN